MHLAELAGKRVFVGLSGGVDSAVTAALLTEAGAAVTGVFLKGWYPPGMHCTWAEDRQDAMRVAAHLGIPFVTVDASQEYKRGVIDYLLSEYRAGRTPNPDVMCNREVKFGAFHRYVEDHSGDFIATGHYAQVVRAGDTQLMRGVDEAKDQSYFLWAIQKEVLPRLVMPLGMYHKAEIRAMAKARNLPVSEKPDSQGICFLGAVSVEDFLRQEFGEQKGVAVDETGAQIGGHDGVLLHTIGERIALTEAPPGPWYVLSKNVERNMLTVSKERRAAGSQKKVISLTNVNILTPVPANTVLTAQYRYHGPVIEGVLTGNDFTLHGELAEEVAAGQSLVMYQDDVCIGGGIIA